MTLSTPGMPHSRQLIDIQAIAPPENFEKAAEIDRTRHINLPDVTKCGSELMLQGSHMNHLGLFTDILVNL
jgi:hypothetical protein